MFLRGKISCVPLIPREAWDPAHHDPKWIDSYAEAIANRREWPARQWLVGITPKTPKEYLGFSLRNLTYEYNAALRACNTFPEMLPFYKEMHTRGVKIDVDTMFIMLSRASRYESITSQELFQLWDELRLAGARPDQATTEIVHTIWDLMPFKSNDASFERFREARRQEIVAMYSFLCTQEMHRYGEKKLFSLMQKTFQRYRDNAKALRSTLAMGCYSIYVSYIIQDTRHPNSLSFTSQVPKNDPAFLNSAASLLKAEGVLVSLRYDIQTSQKKDYFHLEIDQRKESRETYTYCLKKILEEERNRGENQLDTGLVMVYTTALQCAVERYGTCDPENQVRVLFFCRLLQIDIEFNDLKSDCSELWGLLMEVYRFYGRSLASRAVFRQSWNRHLCTAEIMSHYIATVNPWDEKKKFELSDTDPAVDATYLPRISPVRIAPSLKNQTISENSISQALEEEMTVQKGEKSSKITDLGTKLMPHYTADELKKRFDEIVDFALRTNTPRFRRKNEFDRFLIVSGLLWFLRNALEKVPVSEESKPIFAMATTLLREIHGIRNLLLKYNGEIPLKWDPHAYATIELAKHHFPLSVSSLPNEIIGEYIDHLFYLLELIGLRVSDATLRHLLELRMCILRECREDKRLLLVWAEES